MWMENERGLADKGYPVQNGGAYKRDKENDFTAKDLNILGLCHRQTSWRVIISITQTETDDMLFQRL